jgi:hypothetical protein
MLPPSMRKEFNGQSMHMNSVGGDHSLPLPQFFLYPGHVRNTSPFVLLWLANRRRPCKQF